MSADEKGRSYIEGARQELNQYAQTLLRENEKLRAVAAMLESEKRRLEVHANSGSVAEEKEKRQRAEESFHAEKARLQADAVRLQQERDVAVGEFERLRAKFATIEHENYQYLEQYHQIEQQSSNLSNLYVASYQLHSSVDRAVVLNTIQEIVINLIGSEEVAIFEADGSGRFGLASSFGVEPARFGSFALGEGPIGGTLASGEVFTENFPVPGRDRITACVPLKIGDTIIGAIVVFRLLSHKAALERVDHEMFELLAIHASTALYCAGLHAKTAVAEVAG